MLLTDEYVGSYKVVGRRRDNETQISSYAGSYEVVGRRRGNETQIFSYAGSYHKWNEAACQWRKSAARPTRTE